MIIFAKPKLGTGFSWHGLNIGGYFMPRAG